MELIPILATIILVATISTFFLSVGAYVLFKVREKQGDRITVTQPATIQAELVTPETESVEAGTEEQVRRRPSSKVFITPKAPSYKPVEPIKQGPSPLKDHTSPGAKEYTPSKEEEKQRVRSGDQKFSKVEGEKDSKDKDNDKKSGALKWR